MRVLILIALLFTFTVGGFGEAHAVVPDSHTCVYYQMDYDDNANNKSCHSEQNQNHDKNGCDDCCCVHSHPMAESLAPLNFAFNVSKQSIIALTDHHHSISISGLKRPPRL